MLTVFDVQHGSFHDGPGIRTTVFLKGCNLRCFWCQNPESQSIRPEIMIYPNLCISCRQCAEVCPTGAIEFNKGIHTHLRNRCDSCGTCVNTCYAGALKISGCRMREEEILNRVLRDRALYYLC